MRTEWIFLGLAILCFPILILCAFIDTIVNIFRPKGRNLYYGLTEFLLNILDNLAKWL
jgi:hypothetical protein